MRETNAMTPWLLWSLCAAYWFVAAALRSGESGPHGEMLSDELETYTARFWLYLGEVLRERSINGWRHEPEPAGFWTALAAPRG